MKRILYLHFIVFFCCISISFHAQALTQKIIKSNNQIIAQPIENLLKQGQWAKTYKARETLNIIRRIQKVENPTKWWYDTQEKAFRQSYEVANSNTKKERVLNITFYSNTNTVYLENTYQSNGYKIIKANKDFIILQQVKRGFFDEATGQVLTKKERKAKNQEAKNKRLFGGKDIYIYLGIPSRERIVLERVK